MDKELLSLKWNNHHSSFLQVLSCLHMKSSYADVTLACDGKFYKSHKLVLSTCSEYFKEMFEILSDKQPIIVLKDISSEDWESLMKYMYLGEVNVEQGKLTSLIKSADCLKIKGLATPDNEHSFNADKHSKKRNMQMDSSLQEGKRRRSSSLQNDVPVTENSFNNLPGTSMTKIHIQEPEIISIKQEPFEVPVVNAVTEMDSTSPESSSTSPSKEGSQDFWSHPSDPLDATNKSTFNVESRNDDENGQSSFSANNAKKDDVTMESGNKITSCKPKSFYEKYLKTKVPPQYACYLCPKIVKNHYNFEKHLKCHRPVKLKNASFNEPPQPPPPPQPLDRVDASFTTYVRGKRKRFSCKLCPMVMNYSTAMKKHVMVHYGIKPHKCLECDYSAVQKGSLIGHMKNFHKDTNNL